MPPRKTDPRKIVVSKPVKPEPVEEPVVEAVEPESVEADEMGMVPIGDPEPVEPASIEDDDPEEADDLAADLASSGPIQSDGGTDLGLNPGEEILSQRTDDQAIVWAVTNFGRKLRIDPDGVVEVVTGPPLDVVMPSSPVPTPATR